MSDTTPQRPIHNVVSTTDGYTAHLGHLEDCAKPECVAATLAAEQAAHDEHRRAVCEALGRHTDLDWPTIIHRVQGVAEDAAGHARAARQHEEHRRQLADALGEAPRRDWEYLTRSAGASRAEAVQRATALHDARDALGAAGHGPDADDWPAVAPAIRKLAAELALIRGNDEVTRREASKRREALAKTLRRGPGADWYAIHAAAAEAVKRAETAEQEGREARQAETEAVRARKAAEDRLRRIAASGPRADAVQTEIGEMIAQTHDLRDQLQGAEATLARVREVVGEARAVALPWSELDRRLTAIEAALGDTRQRLNAERWRKQAENCDQEHHFTAVEAAPGDPQPTEADPCAHGCAWATDQVTRLGEEMEQPTELRLHGPFEAAAELLINAAVALRNAIGDAS